MTRPWDQIRAHYRSLVKAGSSLRAMHELVRSIESSRYRDGIFAWTSMYDLCIVQTPVNYPYDGPYLRVSPLHDGQLEFRYVDTAIEDKQWSRVVDGPGSFARLERFFEELHWFNDHA